MHFFRNSPLDDVLASIHLFLQHLDQLITQCLQPNTPDDCIAMLTRALLHMRYACSRGKSVQLAIAEQTNLGDAFSMLLTPSSSILSGRPAQLCFQMLVNACSGNAATQRLIWSTHKRTFFAVIDQPSHPHAELCRMIVYMMLLNDVPDTAEAKTLLKSIIAQYRAEIDAKTATIPEHLQFCLEYFCCHRRQMLPLYAPLDDHERVAFLQFTSDYLRQPADGDDAVEQRAVVSKDLVHYWCKEFKKKSDCVLKTEHSYVNSIHPREVYALLEVISTMSGHVDYAAQLAADNSLFLNAGTLLAAISALGQKSQNVFTPVSKLDQIAPNSRESAAIEGDISYDLKAMLVRVVANLAYRNERNQELAREMDILLAVLNCTSVDARNPLIKEWSVLAIRNLCDGCAENQAIIAGLMKVGDADNSDVVKEFNLEMGSMRIGEK